MKYTSLPAAGLCVALTAGAATASEFSGSASVWLQHVKPTNGLDDGDRCDAGGDEVCAAVDGAGGALTGLWQLADGQQLYVDYLYDRHGETNSTIANRDDGAEYHGLGLHYLFPVGDGDTAGVFATLIHGQNNADSDHTGHLIGFGGERSWGATTVQAGAMRMIEDGWDPAHDGVESMVYVNLGHHWSLGSGVMRANLALGTGDFEEWIDNDRGNWAQLGLEYRAPLRGRWEWFAAYQGDFVRVDEPLQNVEQAWFHTVKLGVTISFGGTAQSPFRTPNFRAPITIAGEFN